MSDLDQREYELVYIVQPDVDDSAVSAINERIGQIVVDGGGTVAATELWGRRQLAYPIKNNFTGYYVLHRIQMASTATGDIDRTLRFMEDVLRYMLIRTDE